MTMHLPDREPPRPDYATCVEKSKKAIEESLRLMRSVPETNRICIGPEKRRRAPKTAVPIQADCEPLDSPPDSALP